MGRYYSGDIEGKFVFGSQSSSAADRFGVAGRTPGYLEYYYDETNLEDLETELKNIEDEVKDLVNNTDKMDANKILAEEAKKMKLKDQEEKNRFKDEMKEKIREYL